MDYSAKIDLMKIKGSSICDLKGQTATKRCFIIPIEDSGLYEGQKGLYLNVTLRENKESKYGNTHYITIDLPKELREKLTPEQLKEYKILGNAREYKFTPVPTQPQQQTSQVQPNDNPDGLPF